MIITQAYSIVTALCKGEPLKTADYVAHLGDYNPKNTEFKMLDEYEEIQIPKGKPGFADTVWIHREDKIIILKGDEAWKVEVRCFDHPEIFDEHVQYFKELTEAN